MLICNNCNHQNPDHAEQCSHCHMAGDFTPQEIQGTEEGGQEEESMASCINCGQSISTAAIKCGCCGFPVQRKQENKEMQLGPSLKLLRRIA